MSAVVSRVDARRERLLAGIAALGIGVPDAAPDRLMAFLALLAKWNATFNLTAVRDVRDMLAVHLLDSLAVLPVLDALHATRVLDVGSGAGLPAIPIAVCRPGWSVVSVDAVAKKVGFQRQAKGALHLENLEPRHGRVEALTLDPKPDIIVSRAFAALATMLTAVAHLVDAGTTIVAMKAAEPVDEIRALPAGWIVSSVESLDVPFLGAPRCAVLLRRA